MATLTPPKQSIRIDAERLPTHNVDRYVWMQLKQQVKDSWAIVYDADSISQPTPELFDPHFWEQSEAVRGEALGRGNTLFVDTGFGPAVLRRYLRGGLAAKFSADKYLFLGYQRTRPFAEASILGQLYSQGLPVPQPLGGYCQRRFLAYTGALLTRQIPNAKPLAEWLEAAEQPQLWQAVGGCIRRFHDVGLYHADLNIRNILMDTNGASWLIDFDRARFLRPQSHKLQANLQRLLRSMKKHWQAPPGLIETSWKQLFDAYRQPEDNG